MRTFMRWLLRVLLALFVLVVLLAGAVLTVWEKPTLVLNERTARWALRYAPANTRVSWDSLHLDFSPEGFFAKALRLDLRGLCFASGEIEACAPEIRLDLSFTLAHFKPALTRIGEITVHVAQFTLHPSPPAALDKPTGLLPDLRPPVLPSLALPEGVPAEIGALSIRADSVRIESAAGPALEGSLSLERESGMHVTIHARAHKAKTFMAELDGGADIVPEGLRAKGDLRAVISAWKVRLPFTLAWGKKIKLEGVPIATAAGNRFSTPLSINWEVSRFEVSIGRLVFDKIWEKERVLVDRCRLESRLDGKAGYPKESQLDCALSVFSIAKASLLPPLHMIAKAELELRAGKGDQATAKLTFHEEGHNDYLESTMDLKGSGEFAPNRGDLLGTPQLDFHALFRVPNLQSWLKSLDRTPFAVPAPFRVLAGPANLDLSLDHLNQDELALKANLQTDFEGGRESLVTKHDASIRLAHPFRGPRSLDIKVASELSNVVLEAPPLPLGAPPQFLPDRRFEASAHAVAKAASSASMPVHWHLDLTTGQPLRLRTNLLKHEIPVALQLAFADGGAMAGTIDVQAMPIDVFRKTADLQNIKVTFHEGSDVGDIDGVVLVNNPEVAVKILILGSTDKPRIEFLSDPPLSRQQIVSVLLFNKSADELSEDDASTAGSFSQATADGALGLFSLLFLSKTPIESLGYDPVTQTYTARVRLDQKTTLAVGSDFDQERQVALRRRLGGRWALRTEVHSQPGAPNVLLTLLEWFKRY